MWFVALLLSLVAKGNGRSWMARLFVGGFVLLLLAFFLKLVSRII
jgi:MFS superfamily sulfate permease-like transporter